MSLGRDRSPSERRALIAALAMFNIALMPLFANMIAVSSRSWDFGRAHSFQLGIFLVAAMISLMRWKLSIGLWFDLGATLVAGAMLFRSPEPLAYLTYTAVMLVVGVFLYVVIYVLAARNEGDRRSRSD